MSPLIVSNGRSGKERLRETSQRQPRRSWTEFRSGEVDDHLHMIFEGILYARDFKTIPAITNPQAKNLIVFHKLEH